MIFTVSKEIFKFHEAYLKGLHGGRGKDDVK